MKVVFVRVRDLTLTKRTRQRHSSRPSDVATGHCRPATIRAPDTSNFYIYNFFRQNLKNTHQNEKQTKRQSSTLNQSLVELKVKNHFFLKIKIVKSMPYCEVVGGKEQSAAPDAALNDNGIKIFYRTYGRGPTKVILITGV